VPQKPPPYQKPFAKAVYLEYTFKTTKHILTFILPKERNHQRLKLKEHRQQPTFKVNPTETPISKSL